MGFIMQRNQKQVSLKAICSYNYEKNLRHRENAVLVSKTHKSKRSYRGERLRQTEKNMFNQLVKSGKIRKDDQLGDVLKYN